MGFLFMLLGRGGDDSRRQRKLDRKQRKLDMKANRGRATYNTPVQMGTQQPMNTIAQPTQSYNQGGYSNPVYANQYATQRPVGVETPALEPVYSIPVAEAVKITP
mmetsp:Transcript_11750/g.21438  ORF Transcript_11750/g.21438 Transcript_11750/m.21438 type:complete len:105 (+) Transcript_11750:1607-1921(+)